MTTLPFWVAVAHVEGEKYWLTAEATASAATSAGEPLESAFGFGPWSSWVGIGSVAAIPPFWPAFERAVFSPSAEFG